MRVSLLQLQHLHNRTIPLPFALLHLPNSLLTTVPESHLRSTYCSGQISTSSPLYIYIYIPHRLSVVRRQGTQPARKQRQEQGLLIPIPPAFPYNRARAQASSGGHQESLLFSAPFRVVQGEDMYQNLMQRLDIPNIPNIPENRPAPRVRSVALGQVYRGVEHSAGAARARAAVEGWADVVGVGVRLDPSAAADPGDRPILQDSRDQAVPRPLDHLNVNEGRG